MRLERAWVSAMAMLAVLPATSCSSPPKSDTACSPTGSSEVSAWEGFCLLVSPCLGAANIGATTSCTQVICPACNAADGQVLEFNAFAGSCQFVSPCTLAEIHCFLDAGPAVGLSPECAAAVKLVIEGGLDAGLD